MDFDTSQLILIVVIVVLTIAFAWLQEDHQ